jgi:hypothetical protein
VGSSTELPDKKESWIIIRCALVPIRPRVGTQVPAARAPQPRADFIKSERPSSILDGPKLFGLFSIA